MAGVDSRLKAMTSLSTSATAPRGVIGEDCLSTLIVTFRTEPEQERYSPLMSIHKPKYINYKQRYSLRDLVGNSTGSRVVLSGLDGCRVPDVSRRRSLKIG